MVHFLVEAFHLFSRKNFIKCFHMICEYMASSFWLSYEIWLPYVLLEKWQEQAKIIQIHPSDMRL